MYYNYYTNTYLAMDNIGNIYGKYTNKDPSKFENTNMSSELRKELEDCIFVKKDMSHGNALDICSICNDNVNIKTKKRVKDDLISKKIGLNTLHNNISIESSKEQYMIIKNSNEYEKYKDLIPNVDEVFGVTLNRI